MKKTRKYEPIINQAMRKALDYENPDGQINQFIRFFGEHIGSDRIYIFEDDAEKHVTNNTYEWCAGDVVPQIKFLQNVDMDMIRWWYDVFEKGENVIMMDIESIKDTYPEAYELLKLQSVKNVAVSPFRYNNQISGFFGVDNPPENDMEQISRFLNMIGTFLVLLLKQRNAFRKSRKEAMFSAYSALAEIYLSMHLVNIKTGEFYEIKSTDFIRDNMDRSGDYSFAHQVETVMNILPVDEYKKSVLEFVDVTTLEKRMKGKNTIQTCLKSVRKDSCVFWTVISSKPLMIHMDML